MRDNDWSIITAINRCSMSRKEGKSVDQEEYKKHERVDDQDGRGISVWDLGLTLYRE